MPATARTRGALARISTGPILAKLAYQTRGICARAGQVPSPMSLLTHGGPVVAQVVPTSKPLSSPTKPATISGPMLQQGRDRPPCCSSWRSPTPRADSRSGSCRTADCCACGPERPVPASGMQVQLSLSRLRATVVSVGPVVIDIPASHAPGRRESRIIVCTILEHIPDHTREQCNYPSHEGTMSQSQRETVRE